MIQNPRIKNIKINEKFKPREKKNFEINELYGRQPEQVGRPAPVTFCSSGASKPRVSRLKCQNRRKD